MNNKISTRQLFFFLACVAPVGKLIIMPSQLVYYAKNDLLFPALINFVLQAAVIFCVLLLAKRGMNFFELLSNTFGRIAATILICIFSVFLLYAAVLPLQEQKFFVQGVFYDTLPSILAFAPFFVFCAYLCCKPLGSYGRTWDILGPIAVVGYLGIIILSVGSAKFGALLPVGAAGGKGFISGSTSIMSWFYDSAILLMLLGKFDYKKGMAWKGALLYLAGGLAVLFFLATFYAIFAETAINQLFAFTKTSMYFSGITVLGRIDYLFIYALARVMAFYVSLPVQAAIDGAVQAFGRKKYLATILSIVINSGYLLMMVLLDYRFGEVMHVTNHTLFWIFPVFCIALPPLCLLLRRERRELS